MLVKRKYVVPLVFIGAMILFMNNPANPSANSNMNSNMRSSYIL